MTRYEPVRDATGQIVELRAQGAGLFASLLDDSLTSVGAAPAPEAQSTPPAAPRRWGPIELAGIVGGLLVALLLIALINRVTPAPAAAQLPTPTVAPTAAPLPTAQIVVAFAAPNGEVLGGFDASREELRIVGRWGDGSRWVQVARADGSRVWLRRGDLLLDADDQAALADAPDLAEPTPAPRPTSIPAPVIAPSPAAAPAVCDPDTAPYQVRLPVGVYGTAHGWSCVSQDDAIALAQRHVATIEAYVTATAQAARPTATPTRGDTP